MSAVLDFPVKPEARPYLNWFAQTVEPATPRAVLDIYRRNIARFAELGFPSRKDENWRYVDLESLKRNPLLPPSARHGGDVQAGQIQLAQLALPDADLRLVFVDGKFAWNLSRPNMTGETDFWFGNLVMAAAESEGAELEGILFSRVIEEISKQPANALVALNAALFEDGYILNVPPGMTLDAPIQIIHLATGRSQGAYHTRNLIDLGEGSRASIVELYCGNGRYWRNDVVDIRLGAEAALDRIVLVEESPEAIHLALTDARLDDGAQLSGFALLLGGNRARQEWNVRLAGEEARCEIDGAFVVGGDDEANIVTAIDHAAPGGQTRELIKGVAAGRGHGAFQGRIIVREHAQKTDAHQLSRNLIIGRRAAIDTKPELEILADDVKCSHGASVGELDAAALFYLQARGIPADEARHMLIEGFLAETVEQVADPELRAHLLRRLTARLGTLEG